jgi:azurin
MAAEAPHQFYNQLSSTAEGVLTTLADDMRISGNVMGQPQYVLVLAGEHMRTIAADGWSKSDIRKYVFEHTTSTIAHLKRTGRAGSFSCYIPGWASRTSSQAVTTVIKERRA